MDLLLGLGARHRHRLAMVRGAMMLLIVASVTGLQFNLPREHCIVSRRSALQAGAISLAIGTAMPANALRLCESDEDEKCRRPYQLSNMGGKSNPNQARTREKMKEKAYAKAIKQNAEDVAREAAWRKGKSQQ